ncbi:MAG: tRNA pseudouridine(55) synthase TruB [Clostridia bacterium]|nr:tRNA pseudouridine(55) synthase TruB [Clostridia bacterium]
MTNTPKQNSANRTSTAEPDGVLILDKPAGITSHDCVSKIRRLYHTKKVGHTGTLDPMATGVLPILLGRAAKAAEYVTAEDKHYLCTLRLGMTTDTEDTTGTVVTTSDNIPEEADVRRVISSFIGEIMQVPPMYSALKVNGQKLCDLARQGITVERTPRPVTIHSLVCTNLDAYTYSLDVRCSKGTYIRTLCADIGAALGCGGCMASLRRCGSGSFTLSQVHTLEALEAMSDAERIALLLPTESLFQGLPELHLPAFYERLCTNGQEIYLEKLYGKNNRIPYPSGQRVRLIGEQKGFFALGEVGIYSGGTAVKAVKLFVL